MSVAPFTGAWIEIGTPLNTATEIPVAPFTGAWIEIPGVRIRHDRERSLPSRERGLKCIRRVSKADEAQVAPFTGAWIEMERTGLSPIRTVSRSLHGSVD